MMFTNFEPSYYQSELFLTVAISEPFDRGVPTFIAAALFEGRTRVLDTVEEGWASKETGSDLEKRSSYLGHPIDDNYVPGCKLIETIRMRIFFIELQYSLL